ncbi:carbohydrate ABC transporter permease [Chloroflexi bacterium TSY]|nr:carbohydrate ABC transporter permease [Chloroflexi bacterium TSY]
MASDNIALDAQRRPSTAVIQKDRKLLASFGRGATYVLMGFLAVTTLFPFYYMVATSLMTIPEAFTYPPYLAPPNPQWWNYPNLFQEQPFARFFLNSTIQVIGVMTGRFFLVTMAGYAFARIDFPGRNKVFLGFLAFMMIPNAVTLVSSFIILQSLGWIDTYMALIIPPMTYIWGIFLMRQYFMTLPVSLEDAARIDGASEFTTYFRIFLPLAKPALMVVLLFTFSDIWKQFLWPLIVTRSIEMRTVEVGIALLKNQYNADFPMQMAAATLVSLPIMIIFFLAQEYFLEGINLSGSNK